MHVLYIDMWSMTTSLYVCSWLCSGRMEAILALTARPYGHGHVKGVHDRYAWVCIEDMYGYMKLLTNVDT